MTSTLRARIAGLACLVSLFACGPVLAQEGFSHVRIVRMSFVEGTVEIQRPDVSEWSSAPVNTPIQEGFRLSTSQNSFAEVEFENASTARIGELSLLEFSQLALSPAGDKVNRLTLSQGYATFNFIRQGDDFYEVKTADATLTPMDGKTMFRVDIDAGLTRVAVFKGAVEVSSLSGSGTVSKNMLLEVHPGAEQPFQISEGITKDEWDEWVDQRENAGAALRNKHSPGFYSSDVDSLQYGWNDLWSYGGWSYLSGYGYGWVPYAAAGWTPYSYGRWCWYPGWGYTWISGEPWGWLPYHYGQWVYLPGTGWSWLPGNFGSWYPAQVVWFQGPGWVGWAPRGTTSGGQSGGQVACKNPKACTTVVSSNTFQDGKPVNRGSIVAVDHSEGRFVERPDIPPTRLAMLPGSPHTKSEEKSGITFDPVNGRFVNSHNTAQVSVTTTPTAPRVEGASAPAASPVAAPVEMARPAAEGKLEGQTAISSRGGMTGRPAPLEPPAPAAVNTHGAASRPDVWSLGSSGHSSWGTAHSAPSGGGSFDVHSSSHSASPSSSVSISSSHSSGGGFSGGSTGAGSGGGGGGSGSGGASGGGHSSAGSHH